MTLQVTMLFHEAPEDFALRGDTTAKGLEYWGAWRAYMDAAQAAGIVRGGNALLPADRAVIIRNHGATPQVLDGPYAETKEQLGGYVLLEVPDMETAIAWAARCPAAVRGAVECRPVLPMNAG